MFTTLRPTGNTFLELQAPPTHAITMEGCPLFTPALHGATIKLRVVYPESKKEGQSEKLPEKM